MKRVLYLVSVLLVGVSAFMSGGCALDASTDGDPLLAEHAKDALTVDESTANASSTSVVGDSMNASDRGHSEATIQGFVQPGAPREGNPDPHPLVPGPRPGDDGRHDAVGIVSTGTIQ